MKRKKSALPLLRNPDEATFSLPFPYDMIVKILPRSEWDFLHPPGFPPPPKDRRSRAQIRPTLLGGKCRRLFSFPLPFKIGGPSHSIAGSLHSSMASLSLPPPLLDDDRDLPTALGTSIPLLASLPAVCDLTPTRSQIRKPRLFFSPFLAKHGILLCLSAVPLHLTTSRHIIFSMGHLDAPALIPP